MAAGFDGGGRVIPSIATASGIEFWPLDPRPEDIQIEDIAHALSQQCRFAGHTKQFYSVAEHCVRAADLVPEEHALVALLHDASEAYLVDLPSPVKHQMPDYVEAESRMQKAIYRWAGISVEQEETSHEYVKAADELLLRLEQRDLMPQCDWWPALLLPKHPRITPWDSWDARNRFLDCWHSLIEGAEGF